MKTVSRSEIEDVKYSKEHWGLLGQLRARAEQIMSVFEEIHLSTTVHGSIARGDINANSDIDIFISSSPSSFQVETALEKAKVPVNRRIVIQATPLYAMKAYIEIDEQTSVSFPLMQMRRVELEFYRFGGEVNLTQLKAGVRVAGVDKRLMLIEPTDKGHLESSIMCKEEFVAKTLGISVETVSDRVRALTRRDEVGRTGVFLKKELSPDETFELALKRLSDVNPAVRRRMKK